MPALILPVIYFQIKYFFCFKTNENVKVAEWTSCYERGCVKSYLRPPPTTLLTLSLALGLSLCFPTRDSNYPDFLRIAFLLDQSISQGTVTHKFSKTRSEHFGVQTLLTLFWAVWPSWAPPCAVRCGSSCRPLSLYPRCSWRAQAGSCPDSDRSFLSAEPVARTSAVSSASGQFLFSPV